MGFESFPSQPQEKSEEEVLSEQQEAQQFEQTAQEKYAQIKEALIKALGLDASATPRDVEKAFSESGLDRKALLNLPESASEEDVTAADQELARLTLKEGTRMSKAKKFGLEESASWEEIRQTEKEKFLGKK